VAKLNPNYLPALLLNAEIALDDRKRDVARDEIKKALAVNPNSLDARSLSASIAFLEGRTQAMDTEVKGILAINPRYGEVYRVIGDHAARNYRFDERAALVKQSLTVDDQNTPAYADLGRHLLRTGDEPGARQSLERAFKADDLDVVTYNLLTMMDSLDKFQTVTDGKIIMRFDPEEVGVMKEQAIPLAKEALATLEKLYNVTVTGPILIEMFPKHDDFAVRNVRLPGMIGALGACFGRVVTLDSPRARPPGDFNWGATLWHELAHVVTLQMSKNRVPRWLTEGISVWEEKRARPEWGREMEVTFAHALNEGKILKLDVLNEGFQDPKMISLAYYEASLVVEHIVDTYGEPKLHALLRAYGEGFETEDALKEAVGVSLPQLQTSFDARLEKQYASIRSALKTPEIKGKPSVEECRSSPRPMPGASRFRCAWPRRCANARTSPGAIAALERAGKLIPAANGGQQSERDDSRAIRARAEGHAARDPRARRRPEGRSLRRQLRTQAGRSRRPAQGRCAGRKTPTGVSWRIDPFDVQAETALGKLALKKKDSRTAIQAFRSALASKPARPCRGICRPRRRRTCSPESGPKPNGRRSPHSRFAPSFERAQDLLLKIAEHQ
jgi:tetratricopeptide (TPR) repeat protein